MTNTPEQLHSPDLSSGDQFNTFTRAVLESWWQRELAGKNEHVRLDRTRLSQVAQEHYRDEFVIPNWQMEGIYPQSDETFASYVLTYNTINAAFNFPDGSKYTIPNPQAGGKPLSGSMAMVARFYEIFGEGPITTERLAEAFPSAAAVAQAFQGETEFPYSNQRYDQLFDFIGVLKEMGQNPLDLLAECQVVDETGVVVGYRAFGDETGPGLTELLIERFPIAYGMDRQTLGGSSYPFHKRALLVPLLLHGRAVNSQEPNSILKPFVDIEKIGPILDYQVPRSERGLGFLQLSENLQREIQTWQVIPKNSPEEVELRGASGAGCVELLSAINGLRLAEQLPSITMVELDFWLWSQARVLAKDINPHLTITMAY